MEQPHLQHYEELSEHTFAYASQSHEHAIAYLNRLCETAKPFETEECILLFIARLATRSWIRGELRCEICFADMHECIMRLTALDNGRQNIIFESSLRASFTRTKEFAEKPNMLLPLMLQGSSQQTMILSAPPERRRSTIPPPSFMDADMALAEQHLRPNTLPDLFACPSTGDDGDTMRYYHSPSIDAIRQTHPEIGLAPPPPMPDIALLHTDNLDDGWDVD